MRKEDCLKSAADFYEGTNTLVLYNFKFVCIYVCLCACVCKGKCVRVCVLLHKCIYRIAQNFDGGNFNIFDAFQLDRQCLTRQIV